jgi:hypothetical protein
METAMISVLRQLPKNRRIISAVRQAAMIPSRITPCTAARTKIGLIEQRRDHQFAAAKWKRCGATCSVDLRGDIERRGATA